MQEGIKSIGTYAFKDCKNLVSVTIPSSLTYISAGAFYNCQNLKTVIYEGTKEQWEEVIRNSPYCDIPTPTSFGKVGIDISKIIETDVNTALDLTNVKSFAFETVPALQ